MEQQLVLASSPLRADASLWATADAGSGATAAPELPLECDGFLLQWMSADDAAGGDGDDSALGSALAPPPTLRCLDSAHDDECSRRVLRGARMVLP